VNASKESRVVAKTGRDERRAMTPKQRRALKYSAILAATLAVVCSSPVVAADDADIRKIRVEIRDTEDVPIRGIRVKCRGHSEHSELSSESGLTELFLPPGFKPGDSVEIELDRAVRQRWAFLQPFGGKFNVPRPTQQRYYEITLIRLDVLNSMLTKKPVARSKGAQVNVDVDTLDGLNPRTPKKR
jgi:hypothetical protein